MANPFYSLWAALTRAGTRIPGRQDIGGSGGPAPKPVTADTALALSAVWACVRLISEAVGAMPGRFYEKLDDGTRQPWDAHDLSTLLNGSPNRYQTRNEFFETMTINLLLHGNAYARVARAADGRIVSLMPLMAAQMEVDLGLNGDKIYRYNDGQNVFFIAQENIWHVMLMPSNAIIGLSPIYYGARTMGIAIAAEDRVSILAENGFKPTGVLMIDKLLKEDQRAQIREQFSDLQEGQGDPLKVLEAGMKYQQISMNPKDVQLLETRKFSIEDIARFYGVPSVLINDTTATSVWGSGIAEIKEGFYTLTLQPLLERYEASIKKWLIRPEERSTIDVEFDFSAFLRGNEKTQIETASAAIRGGVQSVNEARRKMGLPPVEGGNTIYLQQQMIPLDKLQEGPVNEPPQIA